MSRWAIVKDDIILSDACENYRDAWSSLRRNQKAEQDVLALFIADKVLCGYEAQRVLVLTEKESASLIK